MHPADACPYGDPGRKQLPSMRTAGWENCWQNTSPAALKAEESGVEQDLTGCVSAGHLIPADLDMEKSEKRSLFGKGDNERNRGQGRQNCWNKSGAYAIAQERTESALSTLKKAAGYRLVNSGSQGG